MRKKDPKKILLEHSKAKVQLLGEYLKAYLGIISSNKNEIHICDLCCGEGLYENNGEGSPLVILRHIKNLCENHINSNNQSRIPKITCHFNDTDTSKIEKLENSVRVKDFVKNNDSALNFTSHDYKLEIIRLKGIFNNFNNEKAFVFIDPYGYKDITAEQIKSLLDCKKVEVLLWLPIQHMYRFRDNGTPEPLLDLIETLNIEVPNENDNVWKFIDELKDGFQNYLGEQYFVDNFSIRRDYKTVYCLYFFTPNAKGLEKMLEAKWKIDPQNGKGWDYTNKQILIFGEQEIRTRIDELENKLEKFLTSDVRVYNGDIYEFTLKQRYLPKHTNTILKKWQDNNKLDVSLYNGDKARKGAFYIEYKYKGHKDNQKTYFTLK